MAEELVGMWTRFTDQGMAHFEELKTLLDRDDPSWRD